MYKRLIASSFPSDHSAFLFGPRQTGKTTIIKSLSCILYIDLLNRKNFVNYSQHPEYLFDTISALKEKDGYIVIDEIQKIPVLLDEVQRCMDHFPQVKFILSGSSARKLRSGAANLLGGRCLYFTLHPLCATELGDQFNLMQAITFGTLPNVSRALKSNNLLLAIRLLKSYVRTYISEEIKAEAVVRNLESFQRFLEVAAHQAAQEINLSELADQAQVSLSSIRNYYSILEDTLIGTFLYPWSISVRKQLAKTEKFYFFDNGVTRALQGNLSVSASNIDKGHLFEQWVVQEVLRLNIYLEKDLKIHFWKTSSGAEVDIVIARARQILLGIECKSTPFPSKRDLSSLKAFAEEYPKVPSFICAPVERRLKIDGRYEAVPPSELYEIINNL